jgi:hypothetical protein
LSSDPREARLRRLYGIGVEEYDALYAYQGGCALCGAQHGKTRLAVDHSHASGEVRGLLCFTCNRKLGERISADWLLKAHQYLTDPPVAKALGRTPQGVVGRVTTRRKRRKKK